MSVRRTITPPVSSTNRSAQNKPLNILSATSVDTLTVDEIFQDVFGSVNQDNVSQVRDELELIDLTGFDDLPVFSRTTVRRSPSPRLRDVNNGVGMRSSTRDASPTRVSPRASPRVESGRLIRVPRKRVVPVSPRTTEVPESLSPPTVQFTPSPRASPRSSPRSSPRTMNGSSPRSSPRLAVEPVEYVTPKRTPTRASPRVNKRGRRARSRLNNDKSLADMRDKFIEVSAKIDEVNANGQVDIKNMTIGEVIEQLNSGSSVIGIEDIMDTISEIYQIDPIRLWLANNFGYLN